MGYNWPHMQTIAETPLFSRQADRLFSEDERREVIDYPAGNPLAGDEIPETGGVRKLRFRALGRGKRGSVRVICCLWRRKIAPFGEDLIQSLNEALAHAKGEGPAIVHEPVTPREVRKQAKLTQAQMATLMGMSVSGYRKWEQGARRVSGPAATLLRIIEREPDAVRRALLASP